MTTTTDVNRAPLERRLNNDATIILYLLVGRDGQCYQQGAPGLVNVEFDPELRRVRGLEAH